MTHAITSVLKSNRMDLKTFAHAWSAGKPITFSPREMKLLLIRIGELDLSNGGFAEIMAAGRSIRASKPATLSTKTIEGLKLNLFSEDEDHGSDVTPYIEPFTVAAAAISAFALGLALGALIENALDDSDGAGSVTITNNGNGTIKGEGDPD